MDSRRFLHIYAEVSLHHKISFPPYIYKNCHVPMGEQIEDEGIKRW